jgi:hypothetical protein
MNRICLVLLDMNNRILGPYVCREAAKRLPPIRTCASMPLPNERPAPALLLSVDEMVRDVVAELLSEGW